MKALSKGYVLEYILWLLLGLLIAILARSSATIFTNPWFFSIVFLYLLVLPGWLLAKILKINLEDFAGRILMFFILSLGFYFLINFIAIFAGIGIGLLAKIIISCLILLFALTLALDILRPRQLSQELNWRVFKIENLYYLLPVVIGVFILWVIFLKGANLDGDPYLHLAIIRKAVDGSALSPRALAFTKTQLINPAYVYPVWHIFLGFLSKTFSISIFQTWSNIIIVLSFIFLLSWYYLCRMIFQKISWTILALLLFMIFVFYAGPGYLFTRLVVPDTLAQLILLPLGLAFVLKYIFQEKPDQKILFLNFLLAFMLLVLHGTHYFYLAITIVVYGLLYATTHWKDEDYKITLLRFFKVFLAGLVALLLIALTIELRSHALSVAIIEFYKSAAVGATASTSFLKFGLLYKYGLILLPLVFLFYRSRRLLFIGATMLLAPIIYWTPLQSIFTKSLSAIFTDRLLANTSLYFFVFALLLGTILLFKDRALIKLSKNLRYFLIGLVILIGILLVVLEILNHFLSDFVYKIFYDKTTNAWFNDHYWWFLVAILGLAAIILIVFSTRKIKIKDLEYKNHLFAFILMAIISYVLISPSIINTANFLRQPKKITGEAYFLNLIKNDQGALGFVKNRVPAKSVILASSTPSKGLATLADQYLAYNVGSSYEEKFAWVFDSTNLDSAKAEIVTDPKWTIDYVLLANPSSEGQHFRLHPELYEKIYQSQQTEIYQVIK